MSKGIARIDHHFLKRLHIGGSHAPNIYFRYKSIVKRLFWERLNVIVNYINSYYSIKKKRCVDFKRVSSSFLILSLPIENSFYVLLMKLYKHKKPIDYYYDSSYVENFLIKVGLSCTEISGVFLISKPLELFTIRKWRLVG